MRRESRAGDGLGVSEKGTLSSFSGQALASERAINIVSLSGCFRVRSTEAATIRLGWNRAVDGHPSTLTARGLLCFCGTGPANASAKRLLSPLERKQELHSFVKLIMTHA